MSNQAIIDQYIIPIEEIKAVSFKLKEIAELELDPFAATVYDTTVTVYQMNRTKEGVHCDPVVRYELDTQELSGIEGNQIKVEPYKKEGSRTPLYLSDSREVFIPLLA